MARLTPTAAGEAFQRLSLLPRLALIALLSLAIFLPGFAALPVTDRDEARFLQASRQMVQSGDLVDIRFQDVPRYKKPVGIYWAQSAAAVLSGQGADAPVWVWRLPSLIGAVAAVVLVAVAGAPLIGAGPASLAALLFAASLVLGGEARIAKTDAALMALIMGMQAVLAHLHMADKSLSPKKQRVLAYAFWVCFGLGVLVKGPIAPMVVGLTLLAVTLLRREARWLRPLAAPLPVALGFAMFLPWLAAITVHSGGAFWQASVGDDLLSKAAAGQEGKGLPPGTYFLLLWLTFWPGSVVLAMALPQIWRRRAEPAMLFLLAWAVPTWLVFEAVPTKLLHYTMPTYPALALLAVAGLAGSGARLSLWAKAIGLVMLLPGVVLAGFAFSLMSEWSGPAGAFTALATASAVAAVLALAAIAMMFRGRLTAGLLGLVAMGGVLHAGVFTGLGRLPGLWPSAQVYQIARRASQERGCAAPLLVGWGYSEPSLVWLGGRGTVLLADDAELSGPLLQNRCTVIARLTTGAVEMPETLIRYGRVDGLAIGAGKKVHLDILLPKGNQ